MSHVRTGARGSCDPCRWDRSGRVDQGSGRRPRGFDRPTITVCVPTRIRPRAGDAGPSRRAALEAQDARRARGAGVLDNASPPESTRPCSPGLGSIGSAGADPPGAMSACTCSRISIVAFQAAKADFVTFLSRRPMAACSRAFSSARSSFLRLIPAWASPGATTFISTSRAASWSGRCYVHRTQVWGGRRYIRTLIRRGRNPLTMPRHRVPAGAALDSEGPRRHAPYPFRRLRRPDAHRRDP